MSPRTYFVPSAVRRSRIVTWCYQRTTPLVLPYGRAAWLARFLP